MKKQQKERKINKKIIVIIAISILCLTVVILLLMTMRTGTQISNQQAAQAMQQAVEDFTQPGELIYENITDKGCEQGTTGLSTRFNCRYIGEKYYKGGKDILTENTLSADMTRMGWQSEGHSINRYNKEIDNALVSLTFTSYGHDDSALQRLLNNGITASLTEGDYIYGERFTITYYHCETNLFTSSCFSNYTIE